MIDIIYLKKLTYNYTEKLYISLIKCNLYLNKVYSNI